MGALLNRVRMYLSGANPGTGTVTLGAAVPGHQTLAAAGAQAGTVYSYAIEEGTLWEVGLGTYNTTTFTRDTVDDSSLGAGNKENFTNGATLFITALKRDITSGDIGDVSYSEAVSKGPSWLKAKGGIVTKSLYPDFAAINGSPINRTTGVSTYVNIAAVASASTNVVVKIGSLWIANVTGGQMYTSSDFVTWTLRATLGANYETSCIAFDGTYVVAVCNGAYVARSADGGLTWTTLGQISSLLLTSETIIERICSAAGLLLALVRCISYDPEVGNNYLIYLMTSSNGGSNWTTQILVNSEYNALPRLNYVGWVGGRFVAMATINSLYNCKLYTSVTGTSGWTGGSIPYGGLAGTGDVYALGASGDRIYAQRLSGPLMVTENQGVTWSYASVLSDTGASLSFNPGTAIYTLGGASLGIAQGGQPNFAFDVDQKTALSIETVAGMYLRSTSQIDEASGTVVSGAATVGGNVRAVMFKPFTYDPITETALPSLTAPKADPTQVGKSLTAWIKVK